MKSPALIGYATMVRKDVGRMIRIWAQTLLPPVVTSSLYFTIFGAFIGNQVQPIDGFTYMQFIVPGLIMMNMLTSAYSNTVFSFYFAKWTHTIDELLVSPMPNWVVIAGFLSGGIVRGFLTGILVTLVSLLFTDLALTNIIVLFAAGFLTALAFSIGGIINAIYAKSFDGMTIVPTFVLTPLTYLGGVFYSIDLLPPFFRTLSLFNPILYMVNAFRYGFLGISDVPLATCFAVIIGFTLAMFLWAMYLFKKGAGLKR
ncbi:MAG: type transport system permease protein [Candidatus Parcubacteria bacterium]|jgi:ABC-2 type transport system permease protein|nr:type transport system permease protein [Candidatus Parcubacteria bacterium]